MNPVERMRTAMSNGVPDCVPVMPQICHPHAIRALGLDFESTLIEAVRKPELMNRLNFECAKMYGVDGFRIWPSAEPADVIKVDGIWYGLDPQTGERLGRLDIQGGGGILPSEEQSIRTDEDVDRIPVVPADELVGARSFQEIKSIVEEAGDDFFVVSYAGDFTVEHLTFNRGKQQAMLDIIDQPEFCHRVLEKALAVAIQRGLALAEIGVDAIMIADTFGGVVSPAQFREFCLPYFQRFVQALKGRGPLIYLHICGNSTRILEMMADTGVDCIEPLDVLGGVSVEDAKARVGNRVALMGGVDTVKLAHGTLQEVRQDIRRCLSGGVENGGYILACADMLPTETSKEKVYAFIEEARSHRYC